jgi:hypothetical protein
LLWEIFKKLHFLMKFIFLMKSPAATVLRLHAMEQFWKAKDRSKAVRAFREKIRIRHAAGRFEIP